MRNKMKWSIVLWILCAMTVFSIGLTFTKTIVLQEVEIVDFGN
jgi:hypothetical protein